MSTRIVKEGNAFYEIDEECLKKWEDRKQGQKDENIPEAEKVPGRQSFPTAGRRHQPDAR
ncbi:MAG: hypothetical protein LUF27_13410 [Lachnospiraceae bacterium]|nr:hypothetical protein [Lachnospiraceae bacterium]